jgi:hypothetical protein
VCNRCRRRAREKAGRVRKVEVLLRERGDGLRETKKAARWIGQVEITLSAAQDVRDDLRTNPTFLDPVSPNKRGLEGSHKHIPLDLGPLVDPSKFTLSSKRHPAAKIRTDTDKAGASLNFHIWLLVYIPRLLGQGSAPRSDTKLMTVFD